MKPVSTRLGDDTFRAVEEIAAEEGKSNSAVVRDLTVAGLRLPDLEAQIADLETDLERARRARRAANGRAEDIGELARTREREQSLAERRAQASVLTRARWWLTGMDGGE